MVNVYYNVIKNSTVQKIWSNPWDSLITKLFSLLDWKIVIFWRAAPANIANNFPREQQKNGVGSTHSPKTENIGVDFFRKFPSEISCSISRKIDEHFVHSHITLRRESENLGKISKSNWCLFRVSFCFCN